MLVGLVAVAAATVIAPVSAGAAPTGTSSGRSQQLPKPKADIVVDAASGRIVTCDNIHEAMHPASTAKIMTALVAAERLPSNATITANAQDAQVETMRIGLPVGKAWPMDQVMASLMMVSANDAAYAIAHTVGGGSLDNFATILNSTGHRLGLKDSTLGDPAGLDDSTSYNGGPTMSAYDLAVATRNALAVPAIAKWAATQYYEFDDVDGIHHRLTNHNPMLPGGDYAYQGATGFKTGYTDRAQHSLVATATRDGRTFIVVILGAVDGGYAEAAQMLDTAFANAAASTSAASATGATASATPACAGEALPPVAVSLYDTRASDRDAFSHLADMPAALAGTDSAGVPASIPVLSSPPHAAPAQTVVTKKHSSSGLFSLRNFAIVTVLLLGGVIALRHRAVKRQRAMRMARRRQRMAAMRSGGLPVVDGRYRTGNRLGPPIESHVRVRKIDEIVDPIEAELDALDV